MKRVKPHQATYGGAAAGCAFFCCVHTGSIPTGFDPLPERAVFVHMRLFRLWSSGHTEPVCHGTVQDRKVQNESFSLFKHVQNKIVRESGCQAKAEIAFIAAKSKRETFLHGPKLSFNSTGSGAD